MIEPTRVGADKFIELIDNASAWRLRRDTRGEWIELYIIRHGEIKMYIPPNPHSMSVLDLAMFRERLEAVTSKPVM